MAHLFLCLLSLSFFLHFAASHLIEVPAAKKECFFEDLHINDQVQRLAQRQLDHLTYRPIPDDRYIPSWGWRSLRHRFLGEAVLLLAPRTSLTQAVDPQPRRKCVKEELTILNWDLDYHCRTGWPVRVLLFQSNEFNCG